MGGYAFVLQAWEPLAARFFDNDFLLDQSLDYFDALDRVGNGLVALSLGRVEQSHQFICPPRDLAGLFPTRDGLAVNTHEFAQGRLRQQHASTADVAKLSAREQGSFGASCPDQAL